MKFLKGLVLSTSKPVMTALILIITLFLLSIVVSFLNGTTEECLIGAYSSVAIVGTDYILLRIVWSIN